jgi:hypothetical protein
MITYDYRTASRPVPIDKKAIANFVESSLVPGIVKWLKRQTNQDEPFSGNKHVYEDVIDVESVDGKEILAAEVEVITKEAKGKWAAVLGGSSTKREFKHGQGRVYVKLWLNGALAPVDFINPKPQELFGRLFVQNRLEPLNQCTDHKCLAYGLFTILIHELTHAAEAFYTKLPEYYLQTPEGKTVVDWKKYVNSPIEVRSHMQQIVDESLRWGHRLFKHKSDLINISLKLSTTWSVIEKDLTPSNRNKILKAVYTAFEEEGLLATQR